MGVTSRTVAVALLALAEATWLATALALVVGRTSAWPGPGTGWFWGLILLAFALGRWILAATSDNTRRTRLALAGAVVGVGVFGVRAWSATQALPPTTLTVLAGGYSWWRGWRLASEGATGSAAQAAFGRGVLFWAITAVVPGQFADERGDLAGALMLFVGASLLAMALGALNDARQGSAGDEGPAFDRTWGAVVGAVIAIVVLAGLLLAAWLAPTTLDAILTRLQPAIRLLTLVAEWILTLLILLVTPLAYLLIWLIRQLSLSNFLRQLPPPVALEPSTNEQAEEALFQIPAWVTTVVEALLIAVLVLVALWILRQALRRYEVEGEDGVVETRHIVASRELVAAQIRTLLAALRASLASQRSAGPFLPLDASRDPRHRIRAAYQKFLAAAAASGLERAPGESPAAFAARLAAERGVPGAPLAGLTAAYEPARYDTGSLDPAQAGTAEAAATALAAWLASNDAGERGK